MSTGLEYKPRLYDQAKDFDIPYELQSRLLIERQISISSDGRSAEFHSRGHGTFAKIIELYVNQRKVLSLTEAVRKMTYQSAQILGIKDRGIIREGMKADIIIFGKVLKPESINYLHWDINCG